MIGSDFCFSFLLSGPLPVFGKFKLSVKIILEIDRFQTALFTVPILSSYLRYFREKFMNENGGVHLITIGCPFQTQYYWKNPLIFKF